MGIGGISLQGRRRAIAAAGLVVVREILTKEEIGFRAGVDEQQGRVRRQQKITRLGGFFLNDGFTNWTCPGRQSVRKVALVAK